MSTRIRQLGQALGTVLALAVFGAWAVLLGRVILPLRRRLRPAEATDLAAQRAMHRRARAFVRWADRIGVARVRVEGAERLAHRRTAFRDWPEPEKGFASR